MNKQQIATALRDRHHEFIMFIDGLTEAQFNYAPQGKWTVGQHLEHIARSVNPLVLAFRLPHIFVGLLFGKNAKTPRSYEEVVAQYEKVLAEGGKASGRFVPKAVDFKSKAALKAKIFKDIDKICGQLEKTKEENLDKYRLPHPLLGKMTMREMLYFTLYHVAHHYKTIQAYKMP